MCSAPKPPAPQAPPAPTPMRDSKIEATQARANKKMRQGGFESTMLTGGAGVTNPAQTASPVLGA